MFTEPYNQQMIIFNLIISLKALMIKWPKRKKMKFIIVLFYDQELAVQEPFTKRSWDTLERRSTVEGGIGSLTVCKKVLIHLFECLCVYIVTPFEY